MAVRGEGPAGITDSRPLVIRDAVELLRMMIRSGQLGHGLAGLRHEARGSWRDGDSLPWRAALR
jgi:hypothetical protein